MCDLIRRQDAIRIVDGIDTWQAGWRGDAIESMKALPSAQPETHEERTETHACDCISRQAIEILADEEKLPSVQPDLSGYSDKLWQKAYERGKVEPQQKWIPCSERMPEAGQKCLVCEKGTIAIDTYIGKGKPYDWRWYMRDYDAWMPLPEPYAERRTDG